MNDSMWLYVQNMHSIEDECIVCIGDDGAEALRRDLIELGQAGWQAWLATHRAMVTKFLTSTPGERAKRKAWSDPVLQRRLAYGAYHSAGLAAAFVEQRDRVRPGGAYRDTCGVAADAATLVCCAYAWRWPFGCDPPFTGWQKVATDD